MRKGVESKSGLDINRGCVHQVVAFDKTCFFF